MTLVLSLMDFSKGTQEILIAYTVQWLEILGSLHFTS